MSQDVQLLVGEGAVDLGALARQELQIRDREQELRAPIVAECAHHFGDQLSLSLSLLGAQFQERHFFVREHQTIELERGAPLEPPAATARRGHAVGIVLGGGEALILVDDASHTQAQLRYQA